MNGKAAQLERWLEAIRRRAHTNSVGQVTCTEETHDLYVAAGLGCLLCKAAL